MVPQAPKSESMHRPESRIAKARGFLCSAEPTEILTAIGEVPNAANRHWLSCTLRSCVTKNYEKRDPYAARAVYFWITGVGL
jgi:hypothetical protein